MPLDELNMPRLHSTSLEPASDSSDWMATENGGDSALAMPGEVIETPGSHCPDFRDSGGGVSDSGGGIALLSVGDPSAHTALRPTSAMPRSCPCCCHQTPRLKRETATEEDGAEEEEEEESNRRDRFTTPACRRCRRPMPPPPPPPRPPPGRTRRHGRDRHTLVLLLTTTVLGLVMRTRMLLMLLLLPEVSVLPATRRRRSTPPAGSLRTPVLIVILGLLLAVARWLPPMPTAEAAKLSDFRCDQDKEDLLACLPSEYSKFELPEKRAVTVIGITLDILEVLRINDKDYSITFSCYFNVHWKEDRIKLSKEFGKEQAGPDQNITNNPDIMVPTNIEFVKDLWVPNILIYNLKTYKVIDVLNKLAGLWIYADKSVLYSQATHITFICPMRFDKFPLDKQSCKFTLGSYSYNDAKMVFLTQEAGYSGNKRANSIALDYSITISPLNPEDTILDYGNLGNYSLAGFEMVLHRYVSTYIITYYLPSGLFVVVSWISFLIPMDVIPGRMALLVTLFLVLVNIFNSVTTNTPKAEGLTAIEAWMLACILFVFGALIE